MISSTDNWVSKRQVMLLFGMNSSTIEKWVTRGEIQVKDRKFNPSQFLEGHHYVTCAVCGKRMAAVGSIHLRLHGMTVSEYKIAHPNVQRECGLSVLCRKRDKSSRDKQRDKMRIFWDSEKGLAEKERQAERMRESNLVNPALKEKRLKNLEKRNTTIPKLIAHAPNENSAAWHRENREESLLFASHARVFRKSTSKLHLRFKAALEGMGVVSETEYKFGFYSLDEAVPDKKISIEIDGCYWHGCDKCKMPGVYPPSQESRKITYLENRGWRILRVKECDINRDIYSVAEMVSKEVENG